MLPSRQPALREPAQSLLLHEVFPESPQLDASFSSCGSQGAWFQLLAHSACPTGITASIPGFAFFSLASKKKNAGWGLSSPTRDQTHVPCTGGVLTTGLAGNSQALVFHTWFYLILPTSLVLMLSSDSVLSSVHRKAQGAVEM